MAIIDFEKSQIFNDNKAEGPLAKLYDNPYDFSNLYYPRNLGSEKRGHYINFYINVANRSQYLQQGNYKVVKDANNNDVAGRTAINRASDNSKEAFSSVMNLLTVRKTKRITQAIALYMPETVNVQYNASWDSSSLTDAGGPLLGLTQGASSIASSAVDSFREKSFKNIAMDPAVAEATAKGLGLGQDTRDFLLYAGGTAINPQIEVLFKGLEMRTFQFDFLFSPHDSEESRNILKIIETFKFHQAPELNAGSMGRYFVPPSEFDIDFLFDGKKNKNIHQIGTCVLQNMNVDYAPNGWSTFSDGMPTQIRMTLQFMETEIVTKQRVMEGY